MCSSQENICITINEAEVKLYSIFFVEYAQLSSLTLTIDDIYTGSSTNSDVLLTDIQTEGTDKYIIKELASGIYRLKLRAAYTNGSVKNYHVCAFVDTEYKCDLVNSTIDGIMMHYALSKVSGCSCNCDQMKELFEAMLAEMNKQKEKCTTC